MPKKTEGFLPMLGAEGVDLDALDVQLLTADKAHATQKTAFLGGVVRG